MNWVQTAAQLPVAFAVVREDPRIDLEVLDHLRPHPNVVMIASGGETALCLAARPLNSLLLVDANPAQLELVRRKWRLAQGDRDLALLVLGHLPGDRRPHLAGLEDGQLGPFDFVCDRGLDYLGRYEAVFQDLQSHGDFQRSFRLDHLVALFGEAATRNPRQPFADHFAERTREARQRPGASQNPFLQQVLHGHFGESPGWDWLTPWNPPRLTPDYRHGEMEAVLRSLPDESADFIHLSNILDWLSPEEGTRLLQETARVLRRSGVTLIRQLNSCLEIPALPSPLTWDRERGQRLAARDRSYFYPQIHWGRRL
ncbi:MAG: DUF3419 family protein [Candidatus Eremiobacteraeota bacterium]|nr:DUF3419 family protein [Candidatus Eremiobacteraeota bacterium]